MRNKQSTVYMHQYPLMKGIIIIILNGGKYGVNIYLDLQFLTSEEIKQYLKIYRGQVLLSIYIRR